jgi:hypothetical protein
VFVNTLMLSLCLPSNGPVRSIESKKWFMSTGAVLLVLENDFFLEMGKGGWFTHDGLGGGGIWA